MPKGGIQIEQLNIVGKRSGEGFVAHKAMLVSTLSRALSARVVLMDLNIGLKGLLGYLKALGGSNVVKMIPSNGSASGSQANGHKRLKVICGANTSYLADNEWIGDKTPLTLCEVRVSPVNTVTPNVGASELAEALVRVLPFTATEDTRPVLQCVLFTARDGKLTLVSADGFRLAVIGLDYDGEGQALINRDDLKGVVNALKRAKRARVSFEGEDVTKTATLIIDTELIRYKWASVDGSYPDYEKLIPTEFNIFAHFDTVEAVKAVNSLKALSDSRSYPIDLTIGDGMITMADPDDKGQAEIPADTMGQGFVRIDGKYFAEALRACGGMAELMLNNAYSPMLFTTDGYNLVVMPMLSDKANEQAKKDREAAKAETEPTKPAESQPEAEKTEPAKPKKAKRSKAKEPVAVA
jgi:DNA polymerase-3 subunit beta